MKNQPNHIANWICVLYITMAYGGEKLFYYVERFVRECDLSLFTMLQYDDVKNVCVTLNDIYRIFTA